MPAAVAVLAFCIPLSASAQIVINEIMQNPSAVPDAAGEWFEVHNPTAAAIDIDGWTIKDNDFDNHVIANGGPLVVPVGGFLVLGNNGDTGSNGGLMVDYVFTDVILSNGADELVLLDAGLSEIDRVEWDGGLLFPDPNGASMSVVNPTLDNNLGTNWCTSSTPYGAGDFGTPGVANVVVCPEPVQIVINEIMQNPSAVSDAVGEWFEVYNPTAAAIDIDGWTVQDNGIDSHLIVNGGPLVVPAGGFLVLGNNGDAGSNGGLNVDYVFSDFFLSNGGDELVLLNADFNEIDRVEWDGGPLFPDPNGASMALIDPTSDNDSGANWCTSSAPFGLGDFGTPGAANVDCADLDQDGVADSVDNCTTITNADQRDSNGDGFGNNCDADLNNDCIVNAVDLGLLKLLFFTADADADFSGDGVVNAVDLGIMKSLFFLPPGPSGLANDCS